ncbi:hypothetical protein GEMRC1_009505 [Eukaryota sp. GEM-RC1]
MSHPPLKSSRSVDDVQLISDSEARTVFSCSGIFSPSEWTTSIDLHVKNIRLQQSLLILIHIHLLRRLLSSFVEVHFRELWRRPSVLKLKKRLLEFYTRVGYVSHCFFESANVSVQYFFRTNTFTVDSKELRQLCSFAFFLRAEVQSVFLWVRDILNIQQEFVCYSHIILGLSVVLNNDSDLEFLNTCRNYFPHLNQVPASEFSGDCIPLFEVLKANVSVTSIDLFGSWIDAELAAPLADMIAVNTTLVYVDISGNYIGHDGAMFLASALEVNTSITSIFLEENSISSKGAAYLAYSLIRNEGITYINLAENYIDVGGAIALVDMLKQNTTLKRIDLSLNSIEDEGILALANAFKVNATVTHVVLSGIGISNEGALALSDMLRVNTSLISIDLSYNYIGDGGAKALIEAFQINSSVKTICLIKNSIEDESVVALLEALKVNKREKIKY